MSDTLQVFGVIGFLLSIASLAIHVRNRHYNDFIDRRGGYQPRRQVDCTPDELTSSKLAEPPKAD